MLKEEIKNITLLLALVTGALYSWGLFFHMGFLSRFGLEESLFPQTFEETLLQGSITIGLFVVLAVSGISIVIYLSLIPMSWLVNYLQGREWYKRMGRKIRARAEAIQNVHLKSEIEIAEKIAFFSYWSFLALFLWALTVLASYQIGFNTAETQLQQSTTSKNRVVTIIHKNLGSFKGYVITCSSSHCAFLTGTEIRVYRLDEITSLVSNVTKA